MRLKDLLAYDDIVIQCHDNPDADSLASGFAVYRYLTSMGKHPALVYGGVRHIRKSNLVTMVKDLEIPISHVERIDTPELLITVDCQYTGGNVEPFPAKHVAVIDHHRVSTKLPKLSEVQSNLGACATLLWRLLKEENYDVDNDRELATALYYGLYTDTNSFTEIVHPLDKDLRDDAKFDASLMTKYRNMNLSLEELGVAGSALLSSDYLDEYRAAIVKAGACDPNVLGIISDLVLEVDAVDICVVFNEQPDGIKLSVRSCIREVKASELVEELCRGIGSGGGHFFKAGGLIQMELMKEEYLRFCEEHRYLPRMEPDYKGQNEQPTQSGIKAVLEKRMTDYLDNTDMIYAQECRMDEAGLQRYLTKPVPWGYVRATELAPEGTPITIRSIRGDMEIVVQENTILTIGSNGAVYRCSEDEFQENYRYYEEWKFYLGATEYRPTVKKRKSGRVNLLSRYARVCIPKKSLPVYARQLERKVKLFFNDREDPYLLGREGDYLVSSTGQMEDAYIMSRKQFEENYILIEEYEQRAVIFDLDGTLLDTLEDLKETVNAVLASRELPPCTIEQVREYVGNGIRNLLIRAVPQGEEHPEFEEMLSFFKEYYGKHCMDHTEPYDNIIHLLMELHARNVPVAIVSNKADFAVKELNRRFFADYVSVTVGEQAGISRKPAPDMVEQALKELGCAKENAIYVGDSEVDLVTAANAGLPCVSVTWGFRDRICLLEHGAETLIDRPLELLRFL